MRKDSKYRKWGVTAAGAALALLAACGPGYGPVGVELAVREPPPARREVIGVAPGPGYVWVAGHNAWQGGDYVWIAGSWQRPPQPRYHQWRPGHWAHARGGWYWVDGHWN